MFCEMRDKVPTCRRARSVTEHGVQLRLRGRSRTLVMHRILAAFRACRNCGGRVWRSPHPALAACAASACTSSRARRRCSVHARTLRGGACGVMVFMFARVPVTKRAARSVWRHGAHLRAGDLGASCVSGPTAAVAGRRCKCMWPPVSHQPAGVGGRQGDVRQNYGSAWAGLRRVTSRRV